GSAASDRDPVAQGRHGTGDRNVAGARRISVVGTDSQSAANLSQQRTSRNRLRKKYAAAPSRGFSNLLTIRCRTGANGIQERKRAASGKAIAVRHTAGAANSGWGQSSHCDFLVGPPLTLVDAFRTALMHVDELLVVEAHQVQDRRMQVVDVQAVFDSMQTDFVGRSVSVAGADAAAGH